MSDNRFQDCETPEKVLMKFWRAMPVAWARELTPDALARIRELTPPAPRTVDKEARERAIQAVCEWWPQALVPPARIDIGYLVSDIIDALGIADPGEHTAATCGMGDETPCQHDTRAGRYCGQCDDDAEPAPVADAPHKCADVADDCCERHHVDLAPDELLTLAKVVDDFERLYNDVAQVVAPDTMRTTLDLDIIDGDLPVRVVCNDDGCWVLRIGGDQ